MLASILRSIGLAPFSALVEAEGEIVALKTAVREKQDAFSLAVNDYDNVKAMAKKLMADYDTMRNRAVPYFYVLDQPKKLTLFFSRGTADLSPVVVKSSVRNNANVTHYNEQRDALNLVLTKWRDQNATDKPTKGRANVAPLDKPGNVSNPHASPKPRSEWPT